MLLDEQRKFLDPYVPLSYVLVQHLLIYPHYYFCHDGLDDSRDHVFFYKKVNIHPIVGDYGVFDP